MHDLGNDFDHKREVLVKLEQVNRFYPTLVMVDPHFAVSRYVHDTGELINGYEGECDRLIDEHNGDILAAIAYLSQQLVAETEDSQEEQTPIH